jgi:hypothetical protein
MLLALLAACFVVVVVLLLIILFSQWIWRGSIIWRDGHSFVAGRPGWLAMHDVAIKMWREEGMAIIGD